MQQWYFVTKIVLTYCEKKHPSDREKLLKFDAEGQEFAEILRSLEQFIQINNRVSRGEEGGQKLPMLPSKKQTKGGHSGRA